jgi:hypothetical protein
MNKVQKHTVGARAVVEVPRLAVDGVGVGVHRRDTGEVRHPLQVINVGVPPLAEDDGLLPVGLGERVGLDAALGTDDERAIDGSAEEGDVGVPPQRTLLCRHVEPVGVVAAGLDRALRHHHRTVRPWRAALERAVPA